MRGKNKTQPSMLCLISPESVVPKDHPIRKIKALDDDVLREVVPHVAQNTNRRRSATDARTTRHGGYGAME